MFDFEQKSYIALRDIVAERTHSIVAWVGSGLSLPAGIPHWNGLLNMLCSECDSKARSLEAEADSKRLMQASKNARSQKNLWVAFEILKKELGNTTYISTVRSALAVGQSNAIPPLYEKLWKLHLAGVLNLNLDRFAARAHSSVHAGKTVNEFIGRRCGDYGHVLQAAHPFIANLHGTSEDASTWVLTHSELRGLLNDVGYLHFIGACLASKTVLFAGISAQDVAAGGHLIRLKNHGIDLGNHFWITARRDVETDQWAEEAGIRVIRYSLQDDHKELHEAIDGLLSYVPRDEPAPPVQPTLVEEGSQTLPPPSELVALPSEQIRKTLNAHAARILREPSVESEAAYGDFCREYSEAIYRAWYVTTEEPNNVLLGNRILDEAAKGAFGRVYRAEAPDGTTVAIKVLHEGVRRDTEMLQSFRRGVRSMQILSARKVEGMVPYRSATEIPACAVMEFVEGPSLLDAVEARRLNEWHDVMRIACALVAIIRRAHQLPERVLHRDIRPSNVMLKGFHTESTWEVVVLDFDLSWHRDAMGVSVDVSSSANGYLAPEQVDRSVRASTRNALVDSYGLGMTLYFLRSGHQPVSAQHKHADWWKTLVENVARHDCPNWKSLPMRFARLIKCATAHSQSNRLDMSQLVGELNRLQSALTSPDDVESAELMAEELASRCSSVQEYEWNIDTNEARLAMPTGLTVSLRGEETTGKVSLALEWIDKGDGERRKIAKWLPKACQKSVSKLSPGGWSAKYDVDKRGRGAVQADIPVTALQGKVSTAARALTRAIQALSMQ